MTMITPSYLGETIEYSSLHACRSTLEDPKDLMGPVLGAQRTKGLIQRVNALEELGSVRELRQFFTL